MIELPRPSFDFSQPRIKVVGLGNAGSNVLDRLVLDGLTGADLIAVNTDTQALTASVAPRRLQIGQSITRGLGAGGDPDVGLSAAEEGIGEILAALSGATVVFLLVGLGGGTGSGAAPRIAEAIRDQNAMVVVVATIPFTFEGKRRAAQADDSLADLRRVADLVLCFENDRMAEAVPAKAGIGEAFAAADETLSRSLRAIIAMTARRGHLHAGFDEIAAAVNGPDTRTLFGWGESSGDNRAHAALEAALRHPLLDRGRCLRESDSVVLHLTSGPDFTLDEIETLTTALRTHLADEVRLLLGATVDPALRGKLTVALFTSNPVDVFSDPQVALEPALPPAVADPEPNFEAEADDAEEEEGDIQPEEELEAAPVAVAAPRAEAPRPFFSKPRPTSEPPRAAAPTTPFQKPPREGRPEQMHFEPVNRGRFEKSEPTIIDGEDLDVPTFMRRSPKE